MLKFGIKTTFPRYTLAAILIISVNYLHMYVLFVFVHVYEYVYVCIYINPINPNIVKYIVKYSETDGFIHAKI